MKCFYLFFATILSICCAFLHSSLAYDVEWLSTSTVKHVTPSLKKNFVIYCYGGTSRNILSLWQTVKFQINISNDEFNQYIGNNPDEVYKQYTEDGYDWSILNTFQKKYKSMSLDLYNTTCMAVNTQHQHSIELQIIRNDLWRILLMFFGIVVIFLSKSLSGNPLFFYLCGILLGAFTSFIIFAYYIYKLLPKKTLTYGILIGGWTLGLFIFQQVWENIQSLIISYQTYVFWYTVTVSFISFIICYRIGPPKNERTKTIVKWMLQTIGAIMILFSSNYKEASAAVAILTLLFKHFPKPILHKIRGYWLRRFPPKRRLLTNEEYYEQGVRETKQALEELRKYCSSPDCRQWNVILKLDDSKRFAKFVEGDSHLNNEEILNYEAYAFSLDRSKKGNNMPSTSSELETTDYSSDSD